MLLAGKGKEGAVSTEMWVVYRSWRKQGKGSLLDPPEETQPLNTTFTVKLDTLILDQWGTLVYGR